MWTLGITKSHNGSVALIQDGKVICAIQAERISRVKRQSIHLNKDRELVSQCVEYCLRYANIRHCDINYIAINTPFNHSTIKNEDLFYCIGGVPNDYKGTFYASHHFSHMEYIVHYSHSSPGIVLIVDGNGSKETDRKQFNISENISTNCISHVHATGRETVSAYWFDGHRAFLIYRFSPQTLGMKKCSPPNSPFLPSIGHYWQWASLYCSGSRTEAGKVMGLAASGDPTVHEKLNILSFQNDGLITIDYEKLFDTFLTPNIFGIDLSNNKHYADIAAMVQNDTEKCLMAILHMLKMKYPTDTLYYAGGVALNVVVNEKIIRSGLFKKVVLNGSAEDNGTAIGAALAASNAIIGQQRVPERITDYYGQTYANGEMLLDIKKCNFSYEFLSEDELYDKVAFLISENRVVAWFQGRSEFGPRALGNRSILANPSNSSMKYILDLHMKHRDRYRPYAPAVLQEYTKQYFDFEGESSVMMREGKVLKKNLPAITHVDGSARVQTVTKADNECFYKLIKSFQKYTGIPVILNTSFNLPGEPIVETPNDALKAFSKSSIEYLCLGNYLLSNKLF